MSHDPHAQSDQTVLDMIERSPVGAVPHTPTYQDALKRLIASHQVYVSADHKGGHVTVRSLATQPAFYANNFEAVQAGTVEVGQLEPDASIFSRYVQSLPEALRAKAEERRTLVVGRTLHHRVKHGGEVTRDPVHSLFLVPGCGPHTGLPGNYLYGSVLEASAETGAGSWSLSIHDGEDGAAMCDVPSQADALSKLEEVIASAPFQLSELDALGFRSN
ncbi:hypothetical protein [Rariglobus hedericola]|uniref:Uncharacterized protein n=1 Tax=Rariglobus hedericola TaxID=2597822 RepID=A0A556QRI5_9BACT|nr:hypothetical protein [Rariglobus hedericola]TSJ79257.1 hypothetical protein FPL22_08180 [Rariglobus hedericola]